MIEFEPEEDNVFEEEEKKVNSLENDERKLDDNERTFLTNLI